jgi:hypothetical protein
MRFDIFDIALAASDKLCGMKQKWMAADDYHLRLVSTRGAPFKKINAASGVRRQFD